MGLPGGGAKQFKSDDIDFRWYPDTQTITINGKLKNEIEERLNFMALVSERLANEMGASRKDGHVGERQVAPIQLNIDDSRDVNAFNRPTVNEAFNDAFNRLEQKIKESNFEVLKKLKTWNKWYLE